MGFPDYSSQQPPITKAERVEWARAALESACAQLAAHPEDPAYRFAVIARWRELEELRRLLGRRSGSAA